MSMHARARGLFLRHLYELKVLKFNLGECFRNNRRRNRKHVGLSVRKIVESHVSQQNIPLLQYTLHSALSTEEFPFADTRRVRAVLS